MKNLILIACSTKTFRVYFTNELFFISVCLYKAIQKIFVRVFISSYNTIMFFISWENVFKKNQEIFHEKIFHATLNKWMIFQYAWKDGDLHLIYQKNFQNILHKRRVFHEYECGDEYLNFLLRKMFRAYFTNKWFFFSMCSKMAI